MICKSCGEMIEEGNSVCIKCGAEVEMSEQPIQKNEVKKLVIGLCVTFSIVAILLVVFLVIVPAIKKKNSKGLQGIYECQSELGNYYMAFDDGAYIIYNDKKLSDICEAGTYKEKDDDIYYFVSLAGDSCETKYDSKEDSILIYGCLKFKAKDKNEKVDISISEHYMDEVKERLEKATQIAMGSEKVYEELQQLGDYYIIEGDDLANPTDMLTKEIAKTIGYQEDNTLSELMEKGYIHVEINSSGDVTVSAYDSIF